MPYEIDIADVLVPGLLPLFVGCLLLLWLFDTVFGRLGLYRHVWHPPLFRVALFVCLFGTAGLWLLR